MTERSIGRMPSRAGEKCNGLTNKKKGATKKSRPPEGDGTDRQKGWKKEGRGMEQNAMKKTKL